MAKPVQISEAAFIGIHAMVLIARNKTEYLNVNQIAEHTGSSRNHIAKVMQSLARFGFVKSVRGPAGGFVLGKDPSEITLLDVYEAIEGKITYSECPFDKHICPFNGCLTEGVIQNLTREFQTYLSSRKIGDML